MEYHTNTFLSSSSFASKEAIEHWGSGIENYKLSYSFREVIKRSYKKFKGGKYRETIIKIGIFPYSKYPCIGFLLSDGSWILPDKVRQCFPNIGEMEDSSN